MRGQAAEFVWPVPGSGYRWVRDDHASLESVVSNDPVAEALGDRSPWLIRRPVGEPKTKKWTGTHPLHDRPSLHREFADLEFTEEAIGAFANKHGMLTTGVVSLRVTEPLASPGAAEIRDPYRGESFRYWCHRIHEMRDVIQLWDLLHRGDGGRPDVEGLKKVIIFKTAKDRTRSGTNKVVFYIPGDPVTGYEHSRLEEVYAREEDEMRKETRFQAAQRAIEGVVASLREGRQHHLSAVPAGRDTELWNRLVATENVVGAARLFVAEALTVEVGRKASLVVTWGTKGESYGLVPLPHDLLGALWLMLFTEITGYGRSRQCPVCGRWFGVPKSGRRIYCTDQACRQKGYRIRKEARRCIAAGEGVAQIAKRTGMDKGALLRFLAQGKETRPDSGEAMK